MRHANRLAAYVNGYSKGDTIETVENSRALDRLGAINDQMSPSPLSEKERERAQEEFNKTVRESKERAEKYGGVGP